MQATQAAAAAVVREVHGQAVQVGGLEAAQRARPPAGEEAAGVAGGRAAKPSPTAARWPRAARDAVAACPGPRSAAAAAEGAREQAAPAAEGGWAGRPAVSPAEGPPAFGAGLSAAAAASAAAGDGSVACPAAKAAASSAEAASWHCPASAVAVAAKGGLLARAGSATPAIPGGHASCELPSRMACQGSSQPDEAHAEVAGPDVQPRKQGPAAWLGLAACLGAALADAEQAALALERLAAAAGGLVGAALGVTGLGALWACSSGPGPAEPIAGWTQQVGLPHAEGWVEGQVEVRCSPPAAQSYTLCQQQV